MVGKSLTRNATILSIIIPMFACIVGSAEIKPETMFSTAATAASKNAGMFCMSLRKKSPMPAQKLVTASCADARSKLAIQLMALHALDRKFFTAENPDASDDASFLPAFLSAVFIALSVAASRVTPNNALTTKSFALLIPSPIFSDTALPTSAHFLYILLDFNPTMTGANAFTTLLFIEAASFLRLSLNICQRSISLALTTAYSSLYLDIKSASALSPSLPLALAAYPIAYIASMVWPMVASSCLFASSCDIYPSSTCFDKDCTALPTFCVSSKYASSLGTFGAELEMLCANCAIFFARSPFAKMTPDSMSCVTASLTFDA